MTSRAFIEALAYNKRIGISHLCGLVSSGNSVLQSLLGFIPRHFRRMSSFLRRPESMFGCSGMFLIKGNIYIIRVYNPHLLATGCARGQFVS